MSIKTLCALALLLAAPASAQETRLVSRRADASLSIGYSSRHGVSADLRFAPRRSSCGPVRRTVQRHIPRRVWVDGYWDRQWVEPIYELRRQSCGTSVRVMVQAGYWHKVWRPGYWSSQSFGSTRARY